MIEEILNDLTPGNAWLWLLGLLIVVGIIRKGQVTAEISHLGTRAPKIPFRIPYGSSPL